MVVNVSSDSAIDCGNVCSNNSGSSCSRMCSHSITVAVVFIVLMSVALAEKWM